MGNACCRAAPGGDGEAVRRIREPEGARRAQVALDCQPDATVTAAVAAALAASSGAAGGGSSTPASPRSLATTLGWHSAVDGSMTDAEEDWHDALSEADLADALSDWEEEGQWHDPAVDDAIQVLKARGHLLPPELEAVARQQRAADQQAFAEEQLRAALEGAARVTVAPSAPLAKPLLPPLGRTRSQELAAALQRPEASAALARAAALAAESRVLAARAAASQAAAAVGTSLEGLAAVLASLTPGQVAPAGLDVCQLAHDAQVVEEALEALDDHSGWMVSRSDALQVYYQHKRGTTIHSLKFRALLDHPPEQLLAVAYEFDLIVTWNKFSLASVKLAQPSTFESFVYGAQWMMRPFKPMQGLLRARGYDLADEHRCLLITLDDCTPEQLPAGHAPLPPEYPKRKLVNFLPGSCLKLKPLPALPDGTPRTEGSLLLHLDPHIPFLPAFLLNFVLGVLAPYVFNQIRKVLAGMFADPQGVYPRRIAAQPEVYGLVQQRMAQFADELRPQAAGAAAAEAARARSGRRRGRARVAHSAGPSPPTTSQ